MHVRHLHSSLCLHLSCVKGTRCDYNHDARLSQVALERSLGRLWETTRRNWLPNPPASASATLIHRANVIDSLVGVVDDMALPAKNTMSTSDQELWKVIIENLTAQDDHSELATTDSRKHRLDSDIVLIELLYNEAVKLQESCSATAPPASSEDEPPTSRLFTLYARADEDAQPRRPLSRNSEVVSPLLEEPEFPKLENSHLKRVAKRTQVLRPAPGPGLALYGHSVSSGALVKERRPKKPSTSAAARLLASARAPGRANGQHSPATSADTAGPLQLLELPSFSTRFALKAGQPRPSPVAVSRRQDHGWRTTASPPSMYHLRDDFDPLATPPGLPSPGATAQSSWLRFSFADAASASSSPRPNTAVGLSPFLPSPKSSPGARASRPESPSSRQASPWSPLFGDGDRHRLSLPCFIGAGSLGASVKPAARHGRRVRLSHMATSVDLPSYGGY